MEREFHLTLSKESMHALGVGAFIPRREEIVPIPRGEESPYLMGRGEHSLSQEERRISLSNGGEESIPYPKETGEYPYPMGGEESIPIRWGEERSLLQNRAPRQDALGMLDQRQQLVYTSYSST